MGPKLKLRCNSWTVNNTHITYIVRLLLRVQGFQITTNPLGCCVWVTMITTSA